MAFWLVVAIGGGISTAVYLYQRGESLKRLHAWTAVATDLALHDVQVTRPGLLESVSLVAKHDGRRVRIGEHEEKGRSLATRVTVDCASGLIADPESLATRFDKMLSGPDFETGDRPFDQEVYLRGTPETTRAILDVSARDLLRQLMQGSLPLEGGRSLVAREVRVTPREIWAHFEGGKDLDYAARIREGLRALLAAAEKLEAPANARRRIAETLAAEPNDGVRLRNLKLLIATCANDPATQAALVQVADDRDPEIQLLAATALVDGRRAALLAVAQQARSGDAIAARAIDTLGADFKANEAVDLMRLARRTGRMAMARAALAAMGRSADATLWEPLAEALSTSPKELGVAAAQALGRLGSLDAEPALLTALSGHGVSAPLRVAIVEALATVGGASAVLPIHEAAEAHGFDLTLRHAAQQSIARIQERLMGASPGQVTLDDGSGGQVSLADEARGRVSLPDRKPD